MSVAIGAYCIEGMIVCADTNVVATDGVVTYGSKIAGRKSTNGSHVIANASDDGNAANMLGNEILDALAKSSGKAIEVTIKSKMEEWYSGYSYGKPPQMSFVLASAMEQSRRLYFCEAPNTVLPKRLGESVAIGMGAQIVDPLLPHVITGAVRMKVSLLLVAYLMYRAKQDIIHLRGSDTNAMVILTNGEIIPIPEEEMAEAEELGPEVDHLLQACVMGLFLRQSPSDEETFLQIFRKTFSDSAEKRGRVRFRSLDDLEN